VLKRLKIKSISIEAIDDELLSRVYSKTLSQKVG
jgi:hypothetical protein